MAVTRYKWATKDVLKLNTLVAIISILICVILLLTMFFMSPKILNMFLVPKLSYDNNVFFEFHTSFYLIKNHVTQKLHVARKCEVGFYPLKSYNIEFTKQALVSYSACPHQWQAQSSHPSLQVVWSI